MKPKFLTLALIFVVSAFFLSSCSGSAFIPSGWTGLTVEEDVAYLAHNQYIFAVNAADGTLAWRYPEKGQANKTFYASPTFLQDGQQLLAASYNNSLYSLNASTMAENWAFESDGHFIAPPLVTSQGIFAPSGDHRLYALDSNKNLMWQYQTGASLWAQPAASPDERVIYLPSMDHRLYALDAANGSVIWQQDLGGALVGTPTQNEDGSVLYIGSFSSKMFALDTQNGAVLWETPLKGWVWSGPALHQETLYFGDLSGNIYAASAVDGSILWERQPDGPIAGTPLVADSGIYLGTESGTVAAYDFNGNTLWNPVQVGGKIYTTPVLYNDSILVAPIETDYRLVSLNLNGTQKWIFTPPK